MKIIRIHNAGNPDVGCLEHTKVLVSSTRKSLQGYQRCSLPSNKPYCRADMLKKGGL